MDQPSADVSISEADWRTWTTRHEEWNEDKDGGQLGQHNSDSSTRTKITHIEGLGYGLIGSVLALRYGTWLKQPAALLVMEFSFRARKRLFRYKDAQISISFDSRTGATGSTPDTATPAISSWYPKNNRKAKRQTEHSNSNPNHTFSSASNTTLDSSPPTEQSIWPVEEFWVRGRTWSHKNRQEAHEVVWSVTESEGNIAGIAEEIRVAVIVKYSGPFRAMVDVKATIGFGLTVRNLPWSQDDPLLFDGNTPKGARPSSSDFSALKLPELLGYISDPMISMDIPQANNENPTHSNTPSKKPIATGSADSMPRRVYRVRGIPFSWSRLSFIEAISASSLKVKADSVQVHSFAENPYRSEKLAVVSFDKSLDEVLKPNKSLEWLVLAQLSTEGATRETQKNNNTIQFLFDTHFHGFSELGLLPANHSPYTTDIVAIGGLGGHAYGSFKERGGTHMWLEGSLAPDLQTTAPGIQISGIPRILIYGYDTHIENSQSFQTIGDLASQLRMSLRAIRQESLCMRPIIFIGHSLGGLLIKELLISLSKGDDVDQSNFKSTRGCLFFGVPNRGMDNSSLVSMVAAQPNKEFLDSLSIESPFLKLQAETFPRLFNFRDSIIFSFYETCVSPKAVIIHGKLTMKGDLVVLVDKNSATHSRPWEVDSRFIVAVDRNHSDLVKFGRYSDDYERVLACIRLLLENATEIVSRRFGPRHTGFS